MQMLRSSILLFVFLTVLCGLIYPLGVTLIAGKSFTRNANGSIIYKEDIAIGSKIIGQKFTQDKYFWGRPSASEYNGLKSGGTNLGPTNPRLLDSISGRLNYLSSKHANSSSPVPIDLLFSSASGLDPEISIDAAIYQASRVADARNISRVGLISLIRDNIAPRTFAVLGEPRVNVLALNIAVDKLGDSSGQYP